MVFFKRLNRPLWFALCTVVLVVNCFLFKFYQLNSSVEILNEIECKRHVLEYLYNVNAFIADVDVLKQLQNRENDVAHVAHVLDSSYQHGYTFGIFNQTIEVKKFMELGFDVYMSYGDYANSSVLTHLFLKTKTYQFQIAVFYNRLHFNWIGVTHVNHKHDAKWFGDTPRAINEFVFKSISDGTNNYLVPSKIDKFLYEYSYSKFFECNQDLKETNDRLLGGNYTQNKRFNARALPILRNIISTLEEFKVHYWLAAGTLLGWYRDCGIIPHTSDIDLGIPVNEYTDSIKKAFTGNRMAPLYLTFGRINDSYELRVFRDYIQFDMFIVYDYNQTHKWCGYQELRSKYRRYLPNFNDYCSAELLKYKVMIPCDPVGYLNNEYGDPEKWQVPKKTNYTWSNLDKIHAEKWSDIDWPYAIRFYKRNGQVDTNTTLKFVNLYSKNQLTKLPD